MIIYYIYCTLDMVCDRCNYFLFWAIFCPFTPLTAQKIKISRKWKKPWRYHHFTRVSKIMIRWCTVPEIWCATNRQMDRMESDLEVGALPKNWCRVFLDKHSKIYILEKSWRDWVSKLNSRFIFYYHLPAVEKCWIKAWLDKQNTSIN